MAMVSLDGLRIEIGHTSGPEQLAGQLEEFAQDLATNKFSEWGVTIERTSPQRLQLKGRKDGTHFDAEVLAEDSKAIISLHGGIELSRFKLTLAGGEAGVRRRVQSELADTLRRHLS